MKRLPLTLILAAVALLSTTGCKQSVTSKKFGPSYHVNLLGYPVEIEDLPAASTSVTENTSIIFGLDGRQLLKIEEGVLTVRGRNYGKLAPGSSILIDADWKVTITPEPSAAPAPASPPRP